MASELKRKRTTPLVERGGKRRHVSSSQDSHSEVSDSEQSRHNDAEDNAAGSEPDNDGWTGMDDADDKDGAGGDAGDVAERFGTRTNKPPKGEELRNIKDATDLYRSTSFKLQIDALLPNVRPKYLRSAPLDRYLLSLHAFLNALPVISPQHPLSASRSLLRTGTAVPYPLPIPTEDTNWKVSFEKPCEILLVGSWALKTSVKSKDQHKYGVDVAVAMPSALFQEKDYLHSRFFHKRAYYLAVIAAAIADENSSMEADVMYESALGDPRLTNLVLRLRPHDSKDDCSALNVEIRIIPVLPSPSPIPLQRLSPSRSNIRTSGDTLRDTPTPLYNSAILLSMTYKTHFLSLHTLKESVPAFDNALALLRVWANQHGYGVGDRLCVRGFEGRGIWWASLLELVVNGEEPISAAFGKPATKRRPLGKGLSSYQLFKAALDFLARHDFSKESVFLKTKEGHQFSPEDYSSHSAVFVDSSSTLNLLAGVPLTSLEMLRYDAQQTLEMLDNSTISDDPFPAVFLKDQRDVSSRFDIILRVDLSSAKLRKPSQQAILEHGSAYNALVAALTEFLHLGLSDRAKAIAVLHPSSHARPTSQAHPSNPSIIYLGLILDTEHAFRLVDRGPAAAEQDSEAVQSFRDFWGEKAELRRFKDGSIAESVVWTVSNSDERAHIPTLIVRHILKRHCGIADDAIQTWQSSFDATLRLPESIATIYRAANAPAGYKAAMAAFDNLVRAMKALDNQLPLAILNVSPITDYLRYTSALNPVSLSRSLLSQLPPCARYAAPMEIIIEFEKSGRWPDDLRAIQKIKLAFFEALAAALIASQKGLKASVVLGDGVSTSDILDQASLDIVTREGWVFSARIWHDREAMLLERTIDDKPHVPKHLRRKLENDPKERRDALDALETYHRRFIHAPRHHRAVAALCHRFTAYSGTVRLVKRWLAAHWLLRGHVSGEVVELLCASVFLRHSKSPGGESVSDTKACVPSSKERGFALVVELLRDWDWTSGLFVPVYGSSDTAGTSDKPAISITAGSRAGVWAVATEFDADGHMWTSAGPDAIVARRVRALAKATWECLQGIEMGKLDVSTLFAHPIEHYDFVVELDPMVLPRYHQNIQADPTVWLKRGKYANARSVEDEARLLLGFDPAQLLYDDLKRIYKDTFMLFHDPLGGNQYGAVWDPSLRTARSFRVLGGFSSIPISKDTEKTKEKEKGMVVLNENAVMSEVERMGAGLIKKVILHV